MAYEEILTSITIPASADLSAYQFRAVKLGATGAALAGAGEAAIGILQDNPNALGVPANVAVAGISKLWVTGAISINGAIRSSTVGIGVASSTGGTPYVFARAQEACSTGVTKVIPVLIVHEGPTSTA